MIYALLKLFGVIPFPLATHTIVILVLFIGGYSNGKHWELGSNRQDLRRGQATAPAVYCGSGFRIRSIACRNSMQKRVSNENPISRGGRRPGVWRLEFGVLGFEINVALIFMLLIFVLHG